MPETKTLLAVMVLALSGSWYAAPAVAQSHQIIQQPRPTSASAKKAIPTSQTKTQAPANKVRPTEPPSKKPIDVFEIGVTKPLTLVEVEQVDYESIVPGQAIADKQVMGGIPAVGEEFVVGGGGVPTGVYLDNGRWVEDGAVFNDESMMSLGEHGEMIPNGEYGDYSEYGEFAEYDEFFESNQQHRPTGTPVSPFWARADALFWGLEGTTVPALVTTSPTGTNRLNAGVIGISGTQTLLGNEKLGNDARGGVRVEVGGWFASRSLGWHVAGFGLDKSSEDIRFDSSQYAILARPFYSVEPSATGPNAELVAFPSQLQGNIHVNQSTSLDGVEFMFHRMLAGDRYRQIQLVGGFQYNSLEDELNINDFKTVTGSSSGLAIGTTLAERDEFHTTNRFGGAAIGVLASGRRERLSFNAGMQMALGNNRARVHIDGSTTSSVPVTALGREIVTTPGGLLAQRTNIGDYEQDTFTVLPQLHAELGYDLNPQLRLMLGYRFLYWSQIARAGEQIDTSLNLSQLDPSGLSGEPRPRFDFNFTDFWAQGINLGLDYRF